jgi:hypothetical protein
VVEILGGLPRLEIIMYTTIPHMNRAPLKCILLYIPGSAEEALFSWLTSGNLSMCGLYASDGGTEET